MSTLFFCMSSRNRFKRSVVLTVSISSAFRKGREVVKGRIDAEARDENRRETDFNIDEQQQAMVK